MGHYNASSDADLEGRRVRDWNRKASNSRLLGPGMSVGRVDPALTFRGASCILGEGKPAGTTGKTGWKETSMSQLPLEHMTTEEKLEVMEAIWRDLARAPQSLPSPSWHADVLNAREARIREGKAQFVDWEDAKKSLLDDEAK